MTLHYMLHYSSMFWSEIGDGCYIILHSTSPSSLMIWKESFEREISFFRVHFFIKFLTLKFILLVFSFYLLTQNCGMMSKIIAGFHLGQQWFQHTITTTLFAWILTFSLFLWVLNLVLNLVCGFTVVHSVLLQITIAKMWHLSIFGPIHKEVLCFACQKTNISP